LSKINISEDNCDDGGDGSFLVLRNVHPYQHFVNPFLIHHLPSFLQVLFHGIHFLVSRGHKTKKWTKKIKSFFGLANN
jgi:hypothetical protein